MMDEVTDSANKEQVLVCFRYVDEQLEAHEEFIGFSQVDSIKSNTIVHVLKDTLIHFNLAISSCRGQYYDGAANMAGVRNGVAKQADEEFRAVFSHCYGYVLNLAVCDTVKQNHVLRDTLETAFGISKLLKYYSPMRDALFSRLKLEINPSTPEFRTLCPTHWTVLAASLKSIKDNYVVLKLLWVLPKERRLDSETSSRISR
jgi:hypothetical protein